jgi:hypothetical protein
MMMVLNSSQYTLLKKNKSDARAQHVGAGKFRHPRRPSGPIYVDDRYFLSTVRGWRNFPSPACCAPASRLAFVTVFCTLQIW